MEKKTTTSKTVQGKAGKDRKFRIYSPDIQKLHDSTFTKSSLKDSNDHREKSLEQSIQFSPIRQTKSPDSHAASKCTKKGLKQTLASNPANSSPSLLQKQISQKLLNQNSQNSLKFLSPKNLNTRKSNKFVRNRFEDTKNWKKIMNVSNGIESTSAFFSSYLVYIGKGNNSSLVKKTILSRSWWSLTEDKEKANFVWTQWKDKAYLSSLPCVMKFHQIDKDYSLGNLKDLTPGAKLITESLSFCALKTEKIVLETMKMHNKIEFNNHLSNKKSLFLTMRDFYSKNEIDVFSKVPLTFHISSRFLDPEYQKFTEKFNEFERSKERHPNFQNLWIVKPGEFTNRGQGISVCKSVDEMTKLIDLSEHTLIVQKYIETPLLISKRKFDIRCYSLVTCINGVMQGYFYLDGYLRTSSQEFSLKDCSNLYVHLTNDAIQKNSKEYGKFENGNKLSYREFQKYLDRRYPERKPNFYSEILPAIKTIVKETILASSGKLDINRRGNCMEIFGYDFMVDRAFKPWLIEVNTNPCLELSSQYLSVLIPAMLDNAFKIAIDTLFPPPVGDYIDLSSENRFELIFHEMVDRTR